MRIAGLACSILLLAVGGTACGSLRHPGGAGDPPATAGESTADLSGGDPTTYLGGGDPTTYLSGGGVTPPSLAALEAYLNAELVRLGKSGAQAVGADGVRPSADARRASRQVSAAPSGSGNAVFDLFAVPVDAGGAPLTLEDISGGAVVSGIRLGFTERLIGDYDQNGEVNSADLVPLAQHWLKSVAYDDPALHGGFAAWPSGSPDDPPVAAASFAVSSLDLPVAATSVADSPDFYRRLKPPPLEANRSSSAVAANNWRLARVDGDGNGEINLADVTPIAAHWQELSAGYRVYRKAPGETAYTALPYTDVSSGGGPPPSFAITLLRSDAYPEGASQPDPARPLRLGMMDNEARGGLLGIGVYSYYVAAYDAQTDAEGPRSPVVSLDLATGNFNLAPVAKLSVSPDFAGAPAVVTLDAIDSYDLDGSLSELQWDLDADGTVDYSTSDPGPPAQSSGGGIDSITPGATPGSGPPLSLSARFTQGSDKYMYPKVRAVDDDGAISAWQSAKLGISGWELETIYSTNPAFVPTWGGLLFSYGSLGVDPLTHELVMTGWRLDFADTAAAGLYFARRQAPGQWVVEHVVDQDDPVWADYGMGVNREGGHQVLWDSDGRPLVRWGQVNQIGTERWSFWARRSNDVKWTSEYSEITPPPSYSKSFLNYFNEIGPGIYYCLKMDFTGSSGQYALGTVYNGLIAYGEPFAHNTELSGITGLAIGLGNAPHALINDHTPSAQYYLGYMLEVEPGVWEQRHYDNGEFEDNITYFSFYKLGFTQSGIPVCLVGRDLPGTEDDPIAIVRVLPTGLDIINIRSGVDGSYDEKNPMIVDGETVTVISHTDAYDIVYSDRIEGQNIISERIVDMSEFPIATSGVGIGGAVLLDGHQIAARVGRNGGELGDDQAASYIAFRVDPRL